MDALEVVILLITYLSVFNMITEINESKVLAKHISCECKWRNSIEETVPTNLSENKANCKTQKFYILLAFLLVTVALLIAVSIYKISTKTKTSITI